MAVFERVSIIEDFLMASQSGAPTRMDTKAEARIDFRPRLFKKRIEGAARKLDQLAAREVIHLRAVHSTFF